MQAAGPSGTSSATQRPDAPNTTPDATLARESATAAQGPSGISTSNAFAPLSPTAPTDPDEQQADPSSIPELPAAAEGDQLGALLRQMKQDFQQQPPTPRLADCATDPRCATALWLNYFPP